MRTGGTYGCARLARLTTVMVDSGCGRLADVEADAEGCWDVIGNVADELADPAVDCRAGFFAAGGGVRDRLRARRA